MNIKSCKKYALYVLIILFTLCPSLKEASVHADKCDISFKLTKTKLLPLESFSVTAENIPENEITSLVLIPAKNKDLYKASLVYCFQGNLRSVIHLCAPGTSGTYKFILIKENLNRDGEPEILASSQEFEVSKIKPSEEQAAYNDIDSFDVLSRQGMSDFGPIQLFHNGKNIKGFCPWNNMNLTGKVRKARDNIIYAELQWVTYTSEGIADQTGNMVLNIHPDGETMQGRYRTGKSEYWTKMKSSWYWWPGYNPIEHNPIIFCKEGTDIKLLWNPIVPKRTPAGYNIYTVNSKGIVSGKPLNGNPIKYTSFSLKMPDMSQKYIVKAVNLDGSEVAVTQITDTANLYDYPLVAYGDDMYSESTRLRNKNIMVEPCSILFRLEYVYKYVYWEKHPDQKGKEQEVFGIEESPKGDTITLSYKKRRLVIKDGSKYYMLNGRKKSWGYTMMKIKNKDGLSYFEIPLSVLAEALDFKAEKQPNGNVVNITFKSII